MVLVSHTHRFIFLKTKKTASTSVEAYFEPFCLDNPPKRIREMRHEHISEVGIVGARGSRQRRAKATFHAHMSAWDVLRAIGPRTWLRYFKFTTIRNPYDKCVSMFYFRFAKDQELLQGSFQKVREAFRDWMLAGSHGHDRYVFRIAGLPVVNQFIRYERLHEDMAEVCDRLGAPYAPDKLPRFKTNTPVADRRHFSEYYDPDTDAVVQRAFGWELNRFGYRLTGHD
jgi:hypothetical protein